MDSVSAPSSPCNNHCIMNPNTNLCDGCFRTIDEIIHWSQFNDKEKIEVLDKLEDRKLSLSDNRDNIFFN